LAAKESHIRDADKLLIAALDISIDYFLRDFNRLTISALIPVPSRPKAIRERGRDFLTEISQIVARNRQIPVSSLLGYSRAVKDQSRLSIEERWSNLEGAFLLQSNRAGDLAVRSSKGSAVLLVDDLVTTGATLLEAERALNYAGIRVAGAVTACVAQPLR
jgi:predicted amidophosphoribosyltransferase